MLEINNIKYRYDKDIYSFNMEANVSEITSIIGNSGSGKSTLLDLIAGFLTPTEGEILFENKNIVGLNTEDRPLTILFQNYNLFEHLTVIQNILLGTADTKKSKNESILESKDILNEVGLEGYENIVVSELSGGQQQRVALSRSLLRKKPILLLDEPFSGLDYNNRTKMLNLLQDITIKNKLIVIMVTHDMEDCNLISQKIYEVKNKSMELYKTP